MRTRGSAARGGVPLIDPHADARRRSSPAQTRGRAGGCRRATADPSRRRWAPPRRGRADARIRVHRIRPSARTSASCARSRARWSHRPRACPGHRPACRVHVLGPVVEPMPPCVVATYSLRSASGIRRRTGSSCIAVRLDEPGGSCHGMDDHRVLVVHSVGDQVGPTASTVARRGGRRRWRGPAPRVGASAFAPPTPAGGGHRRAGVRTSRPPPRRPPRRPARRLYPLFPSSTNQLRRLIASAQLPGHRNHSRRQPISGSASASALPGSTSPRRSARAWPRSPSSGSGRRRPRPGRARPGSATMRPPRRALDAAIACSSRSIARPTPWDERRPRRSDVAGLTPGRRVRPRAAARSLRRPRLAPGTMEEVLALIGRDAVELLTSPARERLRMCSDRTGRPLRRLPAREPAMMLMSTWATGPRSGRSRPAGRGGRRP